MRFTIPLVDLVAALAFTIKSMPRRPAVPILSGVKITADGETVTVHGTDWERWTSVAIDADQVDAPGTAVIGARSLYDYVRKLPKTVKAVTVAVDGVHATVTAGSGSTRFGTMPTEDFPAWPEVPATVGTIGTDTLAALAARVGVAAGTDETLPMMTGINVTTAGSALTACATDRYRLSHAVVTWSPLSVGSEFDALVPADTVADVARCAAKRAGKVAGTVTLGCTPGARKFGAQVAFTFGGYQVITRALDGGNYPPVASLFPAATNATVTVPAAPLVDLVKRVSANAGPTSPVILSFGDDQVTAECAGDDDGATATETLEGVTVAGDAPAAMGFNPAYLVDLVASFGKVDQVTLAIVDAFKPMVATADGVDGYRHLIMPIRVTSGTDVKAPAKRTATEVPAAADAPAPHPFTARMGTRRCAVDGCDRGRTAKVHTVPAAAEVPATEVPADVDQVDAPAEVPAAADATEVPAVTIDAPEMTERYAVTHAAPHNAPPAPACGQSVPLPTGHGIMRAPADVTRSVTRVGPAVRFIDLVTCPACYDTLTGATVPAAADQVATEVPAAPAVAEVPADVDQVDAPAEVPATVDAMRAAIHAVGARFVHAFVPMPAAPAGAAPLVWCTAVTGRMPAGHVAYASTDTMRAHMIDCPACAHLAACAGCTVCDTITGTVPAAPAVAEVPADVDQVDQVDAPAVAEVPAAPDNLARIVAELPARAAAGFPRVDATEVPAVAEVPAAADQVATEVPAAPATEVPADVDQVDAPAPVIAAPVIAAPVPATVHVAGRGDVAGGYRFTLPAGARTRALGKVVRSELGSARATLGASFTVTAPAGSRTVNVVTAEGHQVADWSPVLDMVARTLTAALVDQVAADA